LGQDCHSYDAVLYTILRKEWGQREQLAVVFIKRRHHSKTLLLGRFLDMFVSKCIIFVVSRLVKSPWAIPSTDLKMCF